MWFCCRKFCSRRRRFWNGHRPVCFATCLLHRLRCRRTHRQAFDKHPANVWHRLAANEATSIEQPRVLLMKLLITVVRQNACANFFGNGKHETVAATHCPSRWRNQFVVVNGAIELGRFALVDAMTKRGIHHHRDFGVRKLVHKRQYGFV